MKNLRVGVIGLGIGRGHVREFHRLPDVTVAALADPDAGRLESAGQEFAVNALYADGFEMIRQEGLDIVAVATPNAFHRDYTIAALRAGSHVLCEKPMALNARESAQMLAAARRAGKRIMINFSFRFSPQALALKKEVDAGALGEVYFGRTVWLRRRGVPGLGGWFSRKALSGGGPLIDLGVHRLDLALWLMGYPKPVWVMASVYDHLARDIARRQKKAYDVEDLAVALIKFDNGATLELEASWAGNIKERELMETRLLGTKGGLVHRNLNEGYDFEAELFVERNGVQYDLTPHPPLPTVGGAMAHFVDSLRNSRPHIATGDEGHTVMRLLDAIYASAAKGRPLRIG
jgi:predicted dehydrogenase